MTGPARESAKERALAGWMEAIAAAGWASATADRAAAAAGIDGTALKATLGDRFAALAFFQDQVADAAVEAAANAGNIGDTGGAGGDARARLFDGFMAGFDLLQERRAAVLAIWKARGPSIAVLVGGRIRLDLRRLALAAGVETRSLRGRARSLALALICWRAFQAWLVDDSPDMALTMAALDRLLDKAERAERQGLSPDLLGLPGLSALCGRLRSG